MKKKFPMKTFGKLEEKLSDDNVIAYAYFVKKLFFKQKFKLKA